MSLFLLFGLFHWLIEKAVYFSWHWYCPLFESIHWHVYEHPSSQLWPWRYWTPLYSQKPGKHTVTFCLHLFLCCCCFQNEPLCPVLFKILINLFKYFNDFSSIFKYLHDLTHQHWTGTVRWWDRAEVHRWLFRAQQWAWGMGRMWVVGSRARSGQGSARTCSVGSGNTGRWDRSPLCSHRPGCCRTCT